MEILFFLCGHDADIQMKVKGISNFHGRIGVDAQNQITAAGFYQAVQGCFIGMEALEVFFGRIIVFVYDELKFYSHLKTNNN